jgi:DamX protein
MENPFASGSNNNHTLLLNKWEHHLDLLQHLIRTENVLLAVFGQKGSGKTTLSRQLTAQIGDTMHVYCISAQVSINLTKMLEILQEGFNLPAFDNELLEERLDNQISDLQFHEQTCVLLIDDAEELPEETLQALLYLIKQQSKTQMRLHVVLFGDHELQAKLAKLARQELSGDLIHSIELEPLTLEETRLYLQHRLKGRQLFTSIMIEDIYQSSHGVPERINHFAEQLLLESRSEHQMSTEPNIIKQHQTKIVGGTVLVVMLALVVVFLERGAQHNNILAKETRPAVAFMQPVNRHETALEQQSLNPSNNLAFQSEKPQIKPLVPEKIAANVPQKTQPTPLNTSAVTTKTASLPVAVTSQKPILMTSMGRLITKKLNSSSDTSKSVSPSTSEVYADNTADESVNNAQKPSIATLERAMLTPTVTDVSVVQKKQPVKNRTTTSKHKHKVVNNKKSTVKIVKKSKVKVLVPSVSNKPIMSMRESHYTLQLIALDQKKALQKFITANHLSGKVHTFIIHRNGKILYAVTYGNYPSQAAAKTAVKTLPAAVQKNKVWARSFGSIQREVKK